MDVTLDPKAMLAMLEGQLEGHRDFVKRVRHRATSANIASFAASEQRLIDTIDQWKIDHGL